MRQSRLSGSVEGVMGNHDSYSDYAHADGALATGHQNIVGLRELRLEQAIKRIGNVDLK